MLRELHIRNLAIIPEARIEFEPGLNVFTGETGAGKSLIIGAFELLLGLRPGKSMMRAGADDAGVTGLFEVRPAIGRAAAELLGDEAMMASVDLPADSDEPETRCELLIDRRLSATGRSSVRVNGRPVTSAMLRELGHLLVDIHGQHDHQYLLRPHNQMRTLDAFAGCAEAREAFAERFAVLRELRVEREQLASSATLRRQQLELYHFQADEIDAVETLEGEMPELKARHQMMSSVRRLQNEVGTVYGAMHDMDGSINERLQGAVHVLMDLAEIDEEGLSAIAEQVRTATLSLQEAAFDLSRYLNRLDNNPSEMAEVEERLNALNRLIAKYGDGAPSEDPGGSVLVYRTQIAEEIERLETQDADLSGIDERMEQAETDLKTLGTRLTLARRKAAEAIREPIESQLHELGMPEAKLKIELATGELADAGPGGLDHIEMMVQTNPGQGFRPLREVASGGELSRVMLALKSVLTAGDRVSVLVFDEIDANIGGRLGSVIGRKLRGLTGSKGAVEAVSSKGRRNKSKARENAANAADAGHQVLCITHLPQIAAYGQQHLHIAKAVVGRGKSKQTETTVTRLSGSERVAELAAMMAGQEVTATTRKQAEELLALADE